MNFENIARPPFESRERKPHYPVATLELMGNRTRQEDASGAIEFEKDGKHLMAVAIADGHGSIGKFAAQNAIAVILERLREQDASGNDFNEAFAEIHDIIIRKNVFGGTTLTAALIRPGLITLAWVGNSQARIFSSDEKTLHTLTLPHEYGSHPEETDRLVSQHAIIVDPKHPYTRPKKHGHIGFSGGGHIEISRALGDPEAEPYVLHEPEVKTVVPTSDDRFLVMASDGLWQCIDKHSKRKKVERVLAEAENPEDAKTKLEALLADWKPDDNTTVVIVDLKRS